MSLKALTWVLEEVPVKEPQLRVLLFALADRADDEGRNAFPSQQWLADRCATSPRTIRRQLSALEDRGVIRRGDQFMVKRFRGDRRPVVWDLNFDAKQATTGHSYDRADTAMTANDRTQLCPLRPDTAMSYKPSMNRPIEPSITPPTPSSDETSPTDVDGSSQSERTETPPNLPSPIDNETNPGTGVSAQSARARTGKREVDLAFEQFWQHVSVKRGKQQARKTFEKQLRTHSLEFICSQIDKAQAEWLRTGREPKFWPHPSTWLNAQLDDDYGTTAIPSAADFREAQQAAIHAQHVAEREAQKKYFGLDKDQVIEVDSLPAANWGEPW